MPGVSAEWKDEIEQFIAQPLKNKPTPIDTKNE